VNTEPTRAAALPYFGNISHYSALLRHDVCIDIHEHYVKQSLRNRCELASSQGKFSLTVPVNRPSGLKTALKDITIDYSEDWQNQHLKSVRSAYGASPYFLHYWDEIASIWEEQYVLLMDLNLRSHVLICQLLGIDSNLSLSSDYVEGESLIDLRSSYKRGNQRYSRYIQLFEDRHGFLSDLSLLDLLFCLGPEALDYLKQN